MFTSYPFTLEVCNNAGCTFTDAVTISTAQLAPNYIASPNLTVKGMSVTELLFQLTKIIDSLSFILKMLQLKYYDLYDYAYFIHFYIGVYYTR